MGERGSGNLLKCLKAHLRCQISADFQIFTVTVSRESARRLPVLKTHAHLNCVATLPGEIGRLMSTN